MSDERQQTGWCLCGKVRYRTAEPVHEVGVCHCDMCLRWAGGPLLAIHCKGPVEFEGAEHIVRYKSSDWAERGFCGACGSNLFYLMPSEGDYIIAAGTLDDQASLHMDSQIFIDTKPGWYDFANATKTMTRDEVFAMFAPPASGS